MYIICCIFCVAVYVIKRHITTAEHIYGYEKSVTQHTGNRELNLNNSNKVTNQNMN